jgi:hypothetical protein
MSDVFPKPGKLDNPLIEFIRYCRECKFFVKPIIGGTILHSEECLNVLCNALMNGNIIPFIENTKIKERIVYNTYPKNSYYVKAQPRKKCGTGWGIGSGQGNAAQNWRNNNVEINVPCQNNTQMIPNQNNINTFDSMSIKEENIIFKLIRRNDLSFHIKCIHKTSRDVLIIPIDEYWPIKQEGNKFMSYSEADL